MMTLEQFEIEVLNIAQSYFRLDITTEYKYKNVFIDFSYGLIFRSSGDNMQDVYRSILIELKAFKDSGGVFNIGTRLKGLINDKK